MRPIGLTARIRAALAQGDMSRAQLAEKLGVTSDQIGNLLQSLICRGDVFVVEKRASLTHGPRNIYALSAGAMSTGRYDDSALREAMRAWHG